MYRAVVLTTLVILLLAMVGISVAQESGTFAGGPSSDNPPGSTTPEPTSIEATGLEDTTTSAPPGASSEPEDREDTSERTVVTEPTVVEPEKPTTSSQDGETPTPGPNSFGKPSNSSGGVGKPEHASKAPNVVKPRVEVGHPSNGKSEVGGDEVEHGRGFGRQKIPLCHQGDKTITVGAPALAAHLRHDDTRGGCQGAVSGPEPSGETMGPEAAKSDVGGGRDKVILCHKNKNTLTVGAEAQAAHLRHDDTLGACP